MQQNSINGGCYPVLKPSELSVSVKITQFSEMTEGSSERRVVLGRNQVSVIE